MHPVQRGPGRGARAALAWGSTGHVAVLAGLDAAVGLDPAGWLVGLGGGLLTTALLAFGLARREAGILGPADRVTLFRATLVGGVAALTADSLGTTALDGGPLGALVGLTAVALALDWLDGQVARRTGTVSELGARFDMEVDALLILVLSVHVSPTVGLWVLLIGAARYLRLLACGPWPWMRGAAPARHWGKVVAATQGAALGVVAADVLPTALSTAVLAAALALLAESFGREAWWLWRARPGLAAVATWSAPERVGAVQVSQSASA